MHLLIIPCPFLPRGIDHGTLFYDMPLCMNGELYLGMVKDILYAVRLRSVYLQDYQTYQAKQFIPGTA